MSAMPPIPPASPIAAVKKLRKPLRERSPILAHLRSVFFAGLLTAIPIFITIFILSFVYGLVTKYTTTPAYWIVDHLYGDATAGMNGFLRTAAAATAALLISLLIVYILGLLGTFFICRQILAQVEHFIENLPLIKGIYGTTKQVIAVFRKGGGGAGFQRVVLVEFPRQGTWTIAFVTNTVHDAATGNMTCCFIPMTPNPTSGFFQMFPEDQVRNTDWSVDLGIKIVLSGGLLAPHELDSHASNVSDAPLFASIPPSPPTESARAEGAAPTV
jgi:uncharacterized membrane protein